MRARATSVIKWRHRWVWSVRAHLSRACVAKLVFSRRIIVSSISCPDSATKSYVWGGLKGLPADKKLISLLFLAILGYVLGTFLTLIVSAGGVAFLGESESYAFNISSLIWVPYVIIIRLRLGLLGDFVTAPAKLNEWECLDLVCSCANCWILSREMRLGQLNRLCTEPLPLVPSFFFSNTELRDLVG